MFNFTEFKNEEDTFPLIPKGTIVVALIKIEKGKYNNPTYDLKDDYGTYSENTGSIYLKIKYTVVTGKEKGKSFFDNIGLYSSKGPKWGDMGKRILGRILLSAYAMYDPKKEENQKILSMDKKNIGEYIDGKKCVIRVGVAVDHEGKEKNCLSDIIIPANKNYPAFEDELNNDYNEGIKNERDELVSLESGDIDDAPF